MNTASYFRGSLACRMHINLASEDIMKNIIMIIVIAITAVAFINCNYTPTDEEIAYCNENPDNCTLGDEIVLDNGTALAKGTGGTQAPASDYKITGGTGIKATEYKITGGTGKAETVQ
jgi:hypothetical protein